MGLFEIDITKFAKDILPPEERSAENKSFLKGVLSEFKKSHDIFFQYYSGYAYGINWTAGNYIMGEQVLYMPTGEVFECVVQSTTDEPTTSEDWAKILDSEIGIKEAQYFSDSLISLTYALNRRFQTAYADPPLLSDIYIERVTIGTPMFLVGYTDAESSQVGYNDNDSDVVTYNDVSALNYSFTIWIPAFLSATLGSFDIAAKMTRRFADQFVSAGIIYTIDEY